MKVNRNTLIILGIGILIVVFVVLYMAYSRYVSQRDALLATVDASQNKFSLVSGEKRTLEPQLTQLQQKIADLNASFAKAKGEFPGVSIQSIEYEEEFSKLAEDSSVAVTKLTATDSSTLREGNVTYIVTDFSVEVRGSRTNLLDFIHRVSISKYLGTASINTLKLEEEPVPTPTPGFEPEPPPVNFTTLTLTITIYRYEGS